MYTAKLLKGYVMQDNHLCAKCDMPMMKYQDSIDCVFCPKEEAKKEGLPPAANTPVVNESNEDKASDLVEPAEAPKTVKKVRVFSSSTDYEHFIPNPHTFILYDLSSALTGGEDRPKSAQRAGQGQ